MSNDLLTEMKAISDIIDDMPVFVGETDRWLRFVHTAGRLAKRLVLSGEDLFAVVGSRDPRHPGIAPALAALSGTSSTFQLPRGGRWLYCHVRPTTDDDGVVTGTQLVLVDTTDLHSAQRESDLSSDVLATLVQRIPTMVVVHDESAHVTYANPSFLDTVRRPAEQVIGQSLAELLPERPAAPDDHSLDRPGPALWQGTLALPGGPDRHFVAHRFPVPLATQSGQHGMTGTGSVFFDVTDTVRARQAAAEAEERYRAITDSVRVAIAIVDLDARIQQVNPAFTHLFGRTQAQARGKPVTLVLDPNGVREALPLWHELVVGRRRRYDITLFARKADGRDFPVDLTVTLIRGADGEPQSAVGILSPVPTGLPRAARPAGRVQLTEGEGDVLVGLAAGNTVPSLARRLHLTKRGVDYRIQCIRRKLRNDETVPATIGALVARAYTLGLLRPDSWPPQLHQ